VTRPYHGTSTRLKQVLGVLHQGPQTLKEVSARTNLGQSRVYVLLRTLMADGRVTRSATRGKWGRPAHLYHFQSFEKQHVQPPP
jgi:predicted transcriptional regulator